MTRQIFIILSVNFCLCFCLSLFTSGCYKNPYRQGETLYRYHCGGCHMEDGRGLARLIPALDSSRLTLSRPDKLVCLIRNGKPKNELTGQQMPQNLILNDVEMTNLINFLGSKYASNNQTVQVEEVKKLLANCQTE